MSGPEPQGLRAELIAAVGGIEAFERSFSQRTFSPERRARQEIEDAVTSITGGADAIYEAGGNAEAVSDWIEGYKKRWQAYQAAGARTVNWMITGPARFPVERNQKRMDTEHKRLTELLDYERGAASWIARRLRKAERIAERDEKMAADEGGHKETSFGDIRVVENTAMDRLQIIFPGKPSDEERALLKSRGFRWAPSAGAWQRKLNNNARWAAEHIVKKIEHSQ